MTLELSGLLMVILFGVAILIAVDIVLARNDRDR